MFIDERDDRIHHLESEVSLLKKPSNLLLNVELMSLKIHSQSLDDYNEMGIGLPHFAIDPFGFKGAPFALVSDC